jgi:ABC-type amino acid transport substrate-binding protein
MGFRGIWLCVLLALPCPASALTIMAEDAAQPFSGPDGTGYANDVVKAAFHAVGADLTIDVVPYARCKRAVETGGTAACFSMSWYPGVEKLVAFSKSPVFQVYADVYVNRSSSLKRLADIRSRMVVGTINEYEYPASIDRLGAAGVVLQPASNDTANLKMLALGRIDAAVVMTNDLMSGGQKVAEAGAINDVRYAFRAGIQISYVGFSRKNPQGERARLEFDEGIRRIAANGTLAAIKHKWAERQR